MRLILRKSLSNDALENGAQKHISIINAVGFQKMCSPARVNVRSIKVSVCITKDSKEAAKNIILSVTF